MAHPRRRRTLVLTCIAVVVSSTAFAVGNWKKHPVLHKAYQSLDSARLTIEGKGAHAMTADGEEARFGGHRAKAHDLIVQAQAELQAAIDQYDGGGAAAPAAAALPAPAAPTDPARSL